MQPDINSIFDNNILSESKQYALENPRDEICGLIYHHNNKQKFLKCKNIASKTNKNFIINPQDFEMCSYKGKILACYHSHPIDRSFSHEDIEQSFLNDIPYLLYNIPKDKFYFFDPIKYHYLEKYLNIPFVYGKSDCWNLVSDYFQNELSISLRDPAPDRYLYPDEVIDVSRHIEFFAKSGLKLLPDLKSIKTNDLLVFDGFGTDIATHFAIYLENDLILHNIYLKKTKIQSYRKWHRKYLKYILRHENFI
jgi:proteasome lid subunit RPN8/RPN11